MEDRPRGIYRMEPNENIQPIQGVSPSGSMAILSNSQNYVTTIAEDAYVTLVGSGSFEPIVWGNSPIHRIDPVWTLWHDETIPEPPAQKRKIAKIKKNASEKDVAKAIVKHTKEKARFVSNQTSVLEATITSEEEKLRAKEQIIQTAKNKIGFYRASKNRLSKKQNDILQDFQDAIQALKQEEGVQDITIDNQGRLIVTTAPLMVEKEDWPEPKEAGVYQIRIDFSKNDISNGVKVLNTTQVGNGSYDSPTISQTTCCWGNARKDVQRDFYTQNIGELVPDVIAYIRSPFVEHGYLGMDGQKNKGWEQFFKTATPRENYSWETFDTEHPNLSSNLETDTPVDIESDILSLNDRNLHTVGVATPSNDIDIALMNARRRVSVAEEELGRLRPRPQNPYENDLFHALQYMGFREESLYYYFGKIRQIDRVREMSLEVRDEEAAVLRLNLSRSTRRMYINREELDADRWHELELDFTYRVTLLGGRLMRRTDRNSPVSQELPDMSTTISANREVVETPPMDFREPSRHRDEITTYGTTRNEWNYFDGLQTIGGSYDVAIDPSVILQRSREELARSQAILAMTEAAQGDGTGEGFARGIPDPVETIRTTLTSETGFANGLNALIEESRRI